MAMRDDDKLVRQLSLVAFLMSQQRPVTADEIHEAVEGYGGMTEQAFLRRFYADRAEIDSMGLALSVERPSEDPFQGDLYAMPSENYYLPSVEFDEAELSALQTCLYLLEGQFAYSEPLRLALQHLTLGRPSPLDDHAVRTVSVNLLGGDYSPEVASHITKIESAISRRKTIRFTYYTIGRDEQEEREVDPYSLLYAAGSWYLVGHSHERDDIRVFRLSRIRDRITFTTRAEHDFPPPEDFDLARHRDRAPWQLSQGDDRAEIALTPNIAWWVEQMFGSYGDLAGEEDGPAIFTTTYGSRRELLNWVLGLGREAEIIGPEDLRAEAVAALELVRDRHEADGAAPANAEVVAEEPDDEASESGSLPLPPPEKVVPAERFARLLALMTRLLAACGDEPAIRIPLEDLRVELNLEREVLEEDLNLLNLINFGGGCYALYARVEEDEVEVVKETYSDRFARPARLSPLEAKALLWALEFIGDRLPVDAERPLSSVREKIERAIGEENLPRVEVGGTQTANSDVAAAVNRAIRDDRVLGIEYWTESRGELSEREIEPHLLINSRDAWYVVAWCRLAGDRRTFRLDRIRGAHERDEQFTRRPEMADSGPYLPWGDAPEPTAQSASVWCSPAVARWMVEEHRSRERFSDGSVLVEIPYASEEWLVREIVKYGGEAVLFEPVDLRRTVAARASEMLERYESGDRPAAATR